MKVNRLFGDIFKSGISRIGSLIIQTLYVRFHFPHDLLPWSAAYVAWPILCLGAKEGEELSPPSGYGYPDRFSWLFEQVFYCFNSNLLSPIRNLKSCMSYTIILRTIFVTPIFSIFLSYRFYRLLSNFLKWIFYWWLTQTKFQVPLFKIKTQYENCLCLPRYAIYIHFLVPEKGKVKNFLWR
jgi:hypothetical protein